MKRITLAVLALSLISLTTIFGCKKAEEPQQQPAQEQTQPAPAEQGKEAPMEKK